MSWQMAVVGALGAAQIQQQGAIGKYNQSIANRNAQVKEQEAQILDDKLNLELSQFDKKFRQLQGSQVVQTLKFEEANFARISGEVARQQARLAQLRTATETGTSLLKMGSVSS